MFSKKTDETAHPAPPRAPSKPVSRGNSTFSVIGPDVTIKGNVEASADLHVDGAIEGDITCASIVQGEGSVITGAVEAQTARLAGTIKGSINSRELIILQSARIEGDVHYDALTIEQGAQVEGRFSHAASKSASGGKTAVKGGGDKPIDPNEPSLSLAG